MSKQKRTFGSRFLEESLFGELEMTIEELKKEEARHGKPEQYVVVNNRRVIATSNDQWSIPAIIRKTEKELNNYENSFTIEITEEMPTRVKDKYNNRRKEKR